MFNELRTLPWLVLFAGAGVLSYAAYGSNIQTVVLVNLPADSKMVQAVE